MLSGNFRLPPCALGITSHSLLPAISKKICRRCEKFLRVKNYSLRHYAPVQVGLWSDAISDVEIGRGGCRRIRLRNAECGLKNKKGSASSIRNPKSAFRNRYS